MMPKICRCTVEGGFFHLKFFFQCTETCPWGWWVPALTARKATPQPHPHTKFKCNGNQVRDGLRKHFPLQRYNSYVSSSETAVFELITFRNLFVPDYSISVHPFIHKKGWDIFPSCFKVLVNGFMFGAELRGLKQKREGYRCRENYIQKIYNTLLLCRGILSLFSSSVYSTCCGTNDIKASFLYVKTYLSNKHISDPGTSCTWLQNLFKAQSVWDVEGR